MFATVVKHSALEMWDNCPAVFATNIALIGAGLGLFLGATEIARFGLGFAIAAIVGAVFAAAWLLLMAAHLVDALTAYRTIDRSTAAAVARQCVLPAAIWTTTSLCLAALLWRLGEVALSLPAGAGVAAVLLLVWLVALWVQASLFLLLLMPLKDRDVGSAVSAAVLIVFGSPIFSLAASAVATVLFLLGAFILPGPAGALMLLRNAARMQLRQYAAVETGDGKPDWSRLLADERSRMDRRSALSIIFPWKP